MFPDAQQAKLDKSYTPQRTSAFNKIGESSRQRSGLGLAVQQSNSPYRERASFGVATADSLRGRDYKQEYELLARKVSQMRKENEQMARQMK